MRSLYEAEVAYSDQLVESVVATLEALELTDETIVVLVSDHGESLGEGGHIGHNQLRDVQLQVPMIVRIPGVEPTRVRQPVETVDLMPTLFAALGVEPPYPFQGRNLLPVLRGEDSLGDDRVRIAQQGMRVRVSNREWQWLFDLSGQREERLSRVVEGGGLVEHDLETGWPTEARILKDTFRRMVRESEPLAKSFVVDAELDPTLDEEVRRQLEALGYI